MGPGDDGGAEGREGMDEGNNGVTVGKVTDMFNTKGKGGEGEGEAEGIAVRKWSRRRRTMVAQHQG